MIMLEAGGWRLMEGWRLSDGGRGTEKVRTFSSLYFLSFPSFLLFSSFSSPPPLKTTGQGSSMCVSGGFMPVYKSVY